mmetsp:Transcript_46619/g.53758  ORF Transcript_46619/g.53758 Transcript_46619/m.53758 type:complete len:318 (+) Transcript_46619:533-1486(+)
MHETLNEQELGNSCQMSFFGSLGYCLFTSSTFTFVIADGSKIFFGGCDNKVSAWDLGSNQAQPFGQHNAPVKSVVFLAEMNMAISGSWDQTIKFWDFRSNGPIFTLSYNHKILALECAGPLMVAGFSDRQLAHYNLAKLPQMGQSFREEKMYESPFKNQIRCLSIFSEKNGYAAGSTEGRCAIKYVDLNQQTYVQSKEDFAFKCHRVGASQNTSQPQEVYSVNSIAFAGRHPHSFATAGSDGNFIFWDKNAKSKLKGFGRKPNPVVATHFDMNSNLFAYALAYDWSRGASGYCKQDNNTVGIYLHATPDEEIRPKRK